MASIIPGYEYDIFISYRHKDNKPSYVSQQVSAAPQSQGGWVTEFVNDLQKELESTFKEDVSIYFDSNPIDGLLETHHVDKSLAGKLKTVILIPILSQIYCDERSFAWQNEFCEFNRISSSDAFGRDIKLRSGNVASRVLPVIIHSLDPEDVNLIENQLQSKLRAIDFVFRSPGVNRPLRADDKRQDNTNNLYYRDQVNKVANAVKEIILAIKYPDRVTDMYLGGSIETAEDVDTPAVSKTKAESSTNEKSLAVLPFVSLSHDPTQEYFADGITENILIELANNPLLRVISRTSVMKYKKTDKTAPEIAAELAVKYILEGSAQAHGNKVRITAQLIEAQKDHHIWSKVFVENMDDIFAIQSSVAEVVARELNSSLNATEKEKVKEVPTKNLEAYDLFLKGRHAFNQWNVEGYKTATDYFKKAIEKDPDFKQAYSYTAASYSARMSWNGDLSPTEALKQLDYYLNEAWKRGASDNDYLTKAYVEFFVKKNFAQAITLLNQAIEIAPNNAHLYYSLSYVLCMDGRVDEAIIQLNNASKIEPLSVAYFNFKSICLYLQKRYAEAIEACEEALKLFPMVIRFYDHLAKIHLTEHNYEAALTILETGLRSSRNQPPSMQAYMAIAHIRLQHHAKAYELLKQLLSRSESGEKGVNVYLAHVYTAMNKLDEAMHWIQRAEQTHDIDLIWFQVDPMLQSLREYIKTSSNRDSAKYDAAETYIVQRLKTELSANLYYHNIQHTLDVVNAAEHIAIIEQASEAERKLIRIAALYHDSGFIYSPKNHEEKGCEIVKEQLPGFGFTNDQINTVCGMIMATRIPQSPTNSLEKILCDADLDYLGRDDFFETGRQLYMEMKERGFIETEREWNLIQKTFLESHRYHTDFSKLNRSPIKQKHLQEIIAFFQR